MSTSPNRFKFPGFGLPLNFIPSDKNDPRGEGHELFKNALNRQDLYDGYVGLPLTTLREFTMMHLMNQLTDKPDWHKKIFDDTIASKWRAEALSAESIDITEKMADWCIAELRHKAGIFEKTGAVSVYNGDVVKSDTAVPASLKEALKKAVAPLEDVPARQQDWHPGSDEKVLDLVHPSLFPLIYGRSRILPDSLVGIDDCIKRSGEGEVILVPPEEEATHDLKGTSYGFRAFTNPFSRQFQWLPCEVDISGESTKITSYINNLHPKNKALYAVLEDLISHTIPLWNLTLTPLKARYLHYERIQYSECTYDPDPEAGPETDGPQQEDGEDEDAYSERRQEWYEATRRVVQPEPESFAPPTVSEWMREQYFIEGTDDLLPSKSVDIRRDYSHRGLQVIIKLANIHLTPEKPEYEGGTWHVEGQLNEHICASAIYYYDSDNITTDRLKFRQQSDTDAANDVSYEQDHHDWLQAVYGCEQHGPAVQDIGTADTTEGRLLTWPNLLQHQVQSFKLADHTKPGHRKIVALFLVDPHIRIISTANVPCQQREWWSDAIQQEDGAISSLPMELQDHVFKDVEDFPISLEEAKELRLKLMEERKVYVVEHDKAFSNREFSLCEH